MTCLYLTDSSTTQIYTLSLHDALPILNASSGSFILPSVSAFVAEHRCAGLRLFLLGLARFLGRAQAQERSEEHTSELQSQSKLVCRLLLEKKKVEEVALRPFETTDPNWSA